MKKAFTAVLLSAAFLYSGAALAQTSAPKKTTKKTKTVVTKAVKTDDEAVVDNPVHSETTDDRLYLNHPFFNGEPRWTHADSLYKHGDFPWALVSKNPDNFRFNPESGQWEMLETPNLGKAAPTR